MERARKVLYGADVLANLEISDEYLRHQTEYELRSKLIQLAPALYSGFGVGRRFVDFDVGKSFELCRAVSRRFAFARHRAAGHQTRSRRGDGQAFENRRRAV